MPKKLTIKDIQEDYQKNKLSYSVKSPTFAPKTPRKKNAKV